jgi:hypothetical protein
MQTRSRNTFPTIHTEGSLLPADLLQRILAGDKDLGGLAPADYHLPEGEKLNEAINRSWNRLQGSWAAFQTGRGRLKEGDPGTTLTRERWLLPLFQELGFGRLVTVKALEIEGKSYPISHAWGNTPIHLVGCGVDLDHRAAGVAGASRSSPHSLLQELLNRDDDRLWGLVSNGLRLRILRDNASLTRQAYLEFDLEALFEGENYADFVLFWLLCHQSRFEFTGADSAHPGWLEQWSKAAQERGTRALDQLRAGVEEAITALGSGFLAHPANQNLLARLRSGQLSAQDYYRQLLRLVYRLIFLFAAEDRDLLLNPSADTTAKQRYLRYYSTARLRHLAERLRGGRHSDLWQGLLVVTHILGGRSPLPALGEGPGVRGGGVSPLGLPVLNGFLFSEQALPDLETSRVDNQSLLNAIRSLAFTVEGNTRRAVDYKNLGPEELGSVYESLLELHPIFNTDAGTFELTSASGHERKTTGSYYTPTSLIQVLLDSALDPVIQQAVKNAGPSIESQQSALLNLKVCDPACGSGHFLIAAAHRIARRLAQIQASGDEPSPTALRSALRAVIAHCIYGVDVNPMAVELCKVNLWLESIEPGKPLSFLDAHIQCGDSLVGVSPRLDISEIPDEAFNAVFGDDRATASTLKKRNKAERQGQMGLAIYMIQDAEDLAAWMRRQSQSLDALPEETPDELAQKARTYEEYLQSPQYQRRKLEADLWTAAFFWRIEPVKDKVGLLAPTQEMLRRLRSSGTLPLELEQRASDIAERLRFFHWELAFPQVFTGESPGFDCVLGNPPWERIKLQEEEFFSVRDPEIATAPNKAARQKLIVALNNSNPTLGTAFVEAKHAADAISKFVRASERFPFTAVGDVNTYALFAELSRVIIASNGQTGIIVPSGIATDDSTKSFFQDIVSHKTVRSLYEFENEGFFQSAGQGHMVRFCLLTIVGAGRQNLFAEFLFQGKKVDELKVSERRFELTARDFELFNPNTQTCPICRTKYDAELIRKIYEHVPVLDNERTGANPWGVHFMTMFHMANDSALFITEERDGYLPLYESKMFYQYTHRHGDFKLLESSERKHVLPDIPNELLANSSYKVTPHYWVPELEVKNRVSERWSKNWLLCYRDVTDSRASVRTSVFSILPKVGVGHTAPVVFTSVQDANLVALLLANFNALPFDYMVRQKVAGLHLTYGYLKQLPVLPPSAYASADIAFITPRVLELVYTAYDLKPFAEDMGYHGEPFRWDEERRALLRAELDAYYARLYGLSHDELRYILDPQDVYGPDFPGETFRVLKEKEIKLYGEFRTRRLVLEAWDRLEGLEIGNPAGYIVEKQPDDVGPAKPAKAVSEQRTATKPAVAARTGAEKSRSRDKEIPSPESQPMLPHSDFGLYQCDACGKLVMGFDKDSHLKEKHGGRGVEWRKVRQ